MWQPSDLGTVLAERELLFEQSGKSPSVVRVQFGRPVRSPAPEEGDPWWCPIAISGLGDDRVEMIAGEDSLQALVLGLDYATKTLTSRASEARGAITWLDERERPLFASTWQIDWYERIIADLFEGVRDAIRILEDDTIDSPATVREALRRTLADTHFEPSPRKLGTAKESG